jgi:CheY-like chemotaxis protein
MDDLLPEFLKETNEALAALDTELVKFEQDPSDAEILGNIFRLTHMIKCTSGFLGLPRLEKVARRSEVLLGLFRDGRLEVSPEAVTLVLKCIDCFRSLLDELRKTGEEPEGDDTEIITELETMANDDTSAALLTIEAATGGGGQAVSKELSKENIAASMEAATIDSKEGAAKLGGKRILVVDDSRFFRNLIGPFLSVAGYEVYTAENGNRALQILENGKEFHAIFSDIEMPGMNGFELCQAVKADGRWSNIPMFALSSHATEEFVQRGKEAGFQEYVAKTNRVDLLAVLELALITSVDPPQPAGDAA